MQTILITGGAGFIGANFVQYWLKHHPSNQVIVLDALTYAGNLKNLHTVKQFSNYHFVHGNILDQALLSTLFSQHKIDTVIHFAAESHVDRSIRGPEDFITTNVMGTYTLLEAAKKAGISRFHHVSTDEVYGSLGSNDLPFKESSPYAPNSPYAASKAASDHLVRAYHRTYQLPVTMSQCSNNYGPYQHPEKFIPTVIFSCLSNQPIPVYGDGSNIRDWLYVEDHCSAIDAILQHGTVGESYNIGAQHEISNLTLAKAICELMDSIRPMHQSHQSLISFVKDRPGHDWRYAVDTQKIKTDTGWAPHFHFKQTLQTTVNFYLEKMAYEQA